MSDRPRGSYGPTTPKEWAGYIDTAYIGDDKATHLLVELDEEGYVIVHPDDHPYDCGSIDPEFRSGWKALHNRIFAAAEEPTDWAADEVDAIRTLEQLTAEEPTICPTCDGAGGVDLTDSMILYGVPGGQDFASRCPDCKGTGITTEEEPKMMTGIWPATPGTGTHDLTEGMPTCPTYMTGDGCIHLWRSPPTIDDCCLRCGGRYGDLPIGIHEVDPDANPEAPS